MWPGGGPCPSWQKQGLRGCPHLHAQLLAAAAVQDAPIVGVGVGALGGGLQGAWPAWPAWPAWEAHAVTPAPADARLVSPARQQGPPQGVRFACLFCSGQQPLRRLAGSSQVGRYCAWRCCRAAKACQTAMKRATGNVPGARLTSLARPPLWQRSPQPTGPRHRRKSAQERRPQGHQSSTCRLETARYVGPAVCLGGGARCCSGPGAHSNRAPHAVRSGQEVAGHGARTVSLLSHAACALRTKAPGRVPAQRARRPAHLRSSHAAEV